MADTKLLAHSARFGCPEQSYKEHISEVLRRATQNASSAATYSPHGDLLLSVVRAAALYHDLGKIDQENQKVLGEKPGAHLPVAHTDAGVAYLLQRNSIAAALCVLAHHRPGLPSIPEENSKVYKFRVRTTIRKGRKPVYQRTDENLKEYIRRHEIEMGLNIGLSGKFAPGASFLRFALSCLVDADHADTASHYGKGLDIPEIALVPGMRLTHLDRYINRLTTENVAQERIETRRKFFEVCHKIPQARGIYSCSMPVGTGKTTSVMAHLLTAAECYNLRKVFVVLPFTNIIDQSVATYRTALRLDDEKPEAVVAAHHHRAEYEDPGLMAASFLWDAPITVTTAVQFFETLASNMPTTLRKLHNLAGSAIFIDEAHAALPSHLWPQAWRWLEDLVENWGCHIVLGSGSLARFWELKEFSEKESTILEITSDDLYVKAVGIEKNRVVYPPLLKEQMGVEDLGDWVMALPGPRIVVMNTVQSAAALAGAIFEKGGKNAVEHISTALTTEHRAATLNQVKSRLSNKKDADWTLVATTCVEAGLDFSFRSAARELSSLASLIQIAGRVNRQCEYGKDCEVWSFRIREDGYLSAHPQFRTSAQVLERLYGNQPITPDLCTEAMAKEVRERNTGLAKDDPIVKAEKAGKYPEVAELFKVIEEGEVFTVVIDTDLRNRIEAGGKPSREDMQTLTVRMRLNQIRALNLPQVGPYPDIFFCYPEYYDDFIGYMKRVAETDHLFTERFNLMKNALFIANSLAGYQLGSLGLYGVGLL